MSQSYIIFETKKHTTTNTLFDSQNGLRVRPNIQVPIYVRVLGLNLCFESLRKFWKGKNYVLGPHGSRFSRYQVMVNYPVVFLLANTTLGLATKASNYWLLRSQLPPIVRPSSLYVVFVSFVSCHFHHLVTGMHICRMGACKCTGDIHISQVSNINCLRLEP